MENPRAPRKLAGMSQRSALVTTSRAPRSAITLLRRFAPLALLLVAVLLLSPGCRGSKPIEKGDGDGHAWAPDSDGKFLVVDVENRFEAEIEFVCHARPGIFRLFVEPGKHKYMVLKDANYTLDLRTLKEDAGKAEYLQLEERLLGVRRIHLRVIPKGSAQKEGKSPATPGSGR